MRADATIFSCIRALESIYYYQSLFLYMSTAYYIATWSMPYGTEGKTYSTIEIKPKDFTFDDAETLLKYLDYVRSNKGKTSGSRVMFINEEHGSILLHKPHPQKELKSYQIKQLIEILEQEELI